MHRHLPPLVLLWDESHLWVLLLHRALKALHAPVTLLKAEQVRAGALRSHEGATLLVPGGWARLKSLALGEDGRREIREHIRGGGKYLGFCGGAGLALGSERGAPFLDLCPWSRKAASQRLPNFSGHLNCIVTENGEEYEAALPVWWPSQFQAKDTELEVLARYEGPGPDFWSADLDWSGIAASEVGQWEELYGINLSPERLRREPCIVRGAYGQGSFVLSYAHLETPTSPQANALLCRLLGLDPAPGVPAWDLSREEALWNDKALRSVHAELADLVSFGQSHFLLFWRTPWLLGWRRGVPGSPINFLLAMAWQARHNEATAPAKEYWAEHGTKCSHLCRDFCAQTRDYLLQERRILATSPSSPEASASPGLQRRKQELFGKFPGYGGLYGDILRTLDELLWLQFSAQDDRQGSS
ncbi:Biotin-protein ligase, N terminal [Desulfomicrobium norvegicum]|uniref:Biotin-protein ligase, N terminal n=1 Tax=Desulfomicrobium norvegicum (strain DSM 1741 / NCIMB 8310) TaxID=52561 RepID=A0A8G2FD04_DESNO|nr:BPL-N domain-containing protein [Desulfomicrobium norvegicum]SFL33274.1 Biotin-protein ligase, N terminal [Desulfomicrobium norvegicum]